MSNELQKNNKDEKEKNDNPQWKLEFLFEQFDKESDRAAVILVASILDENLQTLLKSYLVPIPSSTDSLFDSATSPLSNFSSKIDASYRLGLISGKFARDLHLIRKIRNSFAHDIYGCNFENGSVRSRISELENSMSKPWMAEIPSTVKKTEMKLEGPRGKFIFISGAMIWCLTDLISEIQELNEAKHEWFYIVEPSEE